MRVLLDTNIYISYLLPSTREGVIKDIMRAAFAGTFTLLLPQEVAEEFSAANSRKAYLKKRITRAEADLFISALQEVAEILPPLVEELPRISRDRKDDFLLAHAVVGWADYLVTGDTDLLSLKAVGQMQIVSPQDFRHVIEALP
ncbi:MAG: putative toxin-antitoxin system toxin component, PIN family [Chloroflexi bacterium]|nr:putative toxin-antitoxin system toxin component, PIN family [Chloroflexota bacterium]